MWIVRLALRRPYTFVVFSVLMLLFGIATSIESPKDIYPYIDIPVVTIVWSYSGLPPQDMEGRIVTVCERALTTTVNDIEHTESESYQGVAVIRVYFQPKVKVELALAQITAVVQTILRVLPPGTFPPNILKYDASSVPILQLGLAGQGVTEEDLYDMGLSFIRPRLANVKGASVPLPYGGKVRQVQVDVDPNMMYSKHLSATDVSTAINQQNLILPAGLARIGDREFIVKLNSSPSLVAAMNDMPIRSANGAVVQMKDVGQVRLGYAPQVNVVRQNGRRAALLTVLKNGETSTLDIVKGVKRLLPSIIAALPVKGLTITPLFDQSIFVSESISEVVREAAIAAGLTALMILLFLGSWRSTFIVCLSIPLSIATSLVVLWCCGQTINVMTLGGLALAVGILVDDATVEIENTHRNMADETSLIKAILDSASQVAAPALISSLCICLVFTPVVLLSGPARYLFTPLAMAVVFAMLASYFLSRTLVPTMMHFLLEDEVRLYQDPKASRREEEENWLWRIHSKFERWFDAQRDKYDHLLDSALGARPLVLGLFGLFVLLSLPLVFLIGQDFFPYVDSGQMRLHVYPPQGTRPEDAELYFAAIEREIRQVIPPERVELLLDNIGLPNGGFNLAFSDSSVTSDSDGDILIALKPGKRDTQLYMRQLRDSLHAKFPDGIFFFTPANITNQILDFGLPAPIDLQVVGRGKNNYQIAQRLLAQVQAIPGVVDAHIHQQLEQPTIDVNVDRLKARQIGLTQQDIANSMLISLTGTGQTAPNEWLNPQNGVNYQVVVQTPQYRIDSMQSLARTPLTSPQGNASQMLSNVADFQRDITPIIINHYNIQPTFDIYANVDQRDLGGVASAIRKVMNNSVDSLPQGTTLALRGEVETMHESFLRLGFGILFAIILVYLLMVVNFQSWIDPLIILMALPVAFSGVLWMLFLTDTTFSVPSLMGSIMTIGVALANSILVVVFANDERAKGLNASEAAHSAGITRLRPVCMTALAMIIGMGPMALALGQGGEQNAPLGRAVIGGLLFATFGTLFVVPIMYSLLRKHVPGDVGEEVDQAQQEIDERERNEAEERKQKKGGSAEQPSEGTA
jgi:multidrug efflux pump subunit AcrB